MMVRDERWMGNKGMVRRKGHEEEEEEWFYDGRMRWMEDGWIEEMSSSHEGMKHHTRTKQEQNKNRTKTNSATREGK